MTLSAKSDLELVQEFNNGNPVAFNELVRRYQEKIYWVARRILGSHEDADDIVQEVFIKVYESLKEFRGDSSIYTWMYRIAVNLSLNVIRRKKIKDFLRFDELVAPLISEEAVPDKQLEKEEQRTLIEKGIAQLPEKQRIVFILRYYENLPYEEIAKLLKKSVGGLKANYFHAMKKIEGFLKNAQ